MKKGQIAHLDGNRNNNDAENLAFLCFEHHDEFDTKTSQSKGLTRLEVERYRKELLESYGAWDPKLKSRELLNFLASQFDLDALVDGAIKIGGSVLWYGEEHAFSVLTTDRLDSCDADIYMPYLVVLDHFASWGWLTYTEEERDVPGDLPRVFIEVDRAPICDEVARRLLERMIERNGKDAGRLLEIAKSKGWSVPQGIS